MRGLVVTWLAACAASASAKLLPIGSDAEFEEKILSASHCWGVLFVSKDRDAEEYMRAGALMEQMSVSLPGLSLARADVDDVKAVCSEFNVRKRMVPRLLVFNSRARQASIIKLSGLDVESLVAAVKAELTENSQDKEGMYEKQTLAIGGGSDKDEP